MIKKRSIVTTLLLILVMTAYAQTVTWSGKSLETKPAALNDNLYFVRQGSGKVVVYNYDGKQISPEIDSVTYFSEGLALLLYKEYNSQYSRYKLWKLLAEDGSLTDAPSDYYVGDYPFFSEGLLPVYKSNGRYGFIDKDCNLIIKCECTRVYPFSEGYASVRKETFANKIVNIFASDVKDYVAYIDKNGVELTLDNSLGSIQAGSSFYNNEALVRSKDNRNCYINRDGQIIREKGAVDVVYDWKHRISSENNPLGPVFTLNPDVTPAISNGRYGYKNKQGVWVVPAQFLSAEPFNKSGYSIVELPDKRYGVLKLTDGAFEITQELNPLVPASDPEKESILVKVKVPEAFRKQDLVLAVASAGAKPQTITLPADTASVRFAQLQIPLENRSYNISSGTLTLFAKDSEPITPDADLQFKGIRLTQRADKNDNQPIAIDITNPGKRNYKCSISFEGKSLVMDDIDINLAPGETLRVKGYFSKVKKHENRRITINIGDKNDKVYINVVPIVGKI